jgi:hypothetical protein
MDAYRSLAWHASKLNTLSRYSDLGIACHIAVAVCKVSFDGSGIKNAFPNTATGQGRSRQHRKRGRIDSYSAVPMAAGQAIIGPAVAHSRPEYIHLPLKDDQPYFYASKKYPLSVRLGSG